MKHLSKRAAEARGEEFASSHKAFMEHREVLAKDLEDAIKVGKEMVFMLSGYSPVTSCLAAHTLAVELRRQHPGIFALFAKVGV